MKKLDKINEKINILKNKNMTDRPRIKNFKRTIRRRNIVKLEIKKKNFVKEFHNQTIRHLLNTNDVIFYGDIKSHNIVKNKDYQQKLNTNINDLKFFQFKQKLLLKARLENKYVHLIGEQLTTQTCSSCGTLNKPGASKVYECSECKSVIDRDLNSAKNIALKGLVKCQCD